MMNCTTTRISSKDKIEIQNELKRITVESLRSWEPPFNEETFLKEFSQTEDLLIVIDSFLIKGYNNWENVVLSSMQEDREKGYKLYTHHIDDIHISLLSNTSGAVTVFYTWEYITKEDLHYKVKARATSAYKKLKCNWVRLQFIVSHGDQEKIN